MVADKLTKEFLTEEYTNKKRDKRDISRETGYSPKTITNYLEKYGIPRNDSEKDIKDITDQKFGRLTATKLGPRDKHGKSRWVCKCECGNEKLVNSASLIRGLSTSCGCYKHELLHRGYKDISVQHWRRIVKGAVERGYEFTITPEFVWELYESQGRKCALSGIPVAFFCDHNKSHLNTASVDRIDSSKGYVPGNVQIVNKIVNRMKNWFDNDEFIAYCNLIARENEMTDEDCQKRVGRTILRKARH